MADGAAGDLLLFRSLQRGLLPLDGNFRVPRTVRRALSRGPSYKLALNHSFEAVLADCSGRSDTWISEELKAVYRRLHADGLVHSVEVHDDDGLAAGMIGLAIGACWIGESMAHRRPQAGHALLVGLVQALRQGGFELFDVQLSNAHLRRFGCFELDDDAFRRRLERARARTAYLRLHDGFLASEAWMAGWT
jgi:leucyl/phenylalanyl-tRNA--protein transferase